MKISGRSSSVGDQACLVGYLALMTGWRNKNPKPSASSLSFMLLAQAYFSAVASSSKTGHFFYY
jgi:hypothetical protein